MLNKKEMADRLGIHEQTVDRWAEYGIIKAHFYNDHGWQLYEIPGPKSRPNIAVDGIGWWIERQVCRQAPSMGSNLKRCSVKTVSWSPARTPARRKMWSSTSYDLCEAPRYVELTLARASLSSL